MASLACGGGNACSAFLLLFRYLSVYSIIDFVDIAIRLK
jgi:hypothetical protein